MYSPPMRQLPALSRMGLYSFHTLIGDFNAAGMRDMVRASAKPEPRICPRQGH